MAIAVTHQIVPALSLKTQLAFAFSQNQQFKVIFRLEILELQRVGSILLQLATDLNSATDNFQYKIYEINSASIAASISAKIAAAYAKGTFANVSIYGMGTISGYIGTETSYHSPVSAFYMDAIQKHLALGMATGVSGNTVFITVMFALATEFVPK